MMKEQNRFFSLSRQQASSVPMSSFRHTNIGGARGLGLGATILENIHTVIDRENERRITPYHRRVTTYAH
jgi:hypothetical protein